MKIELTKERKEELYRRACSRALLRSCDPTIPAPAPAPLASLASIPVHVVRPLRSVL